VTSDGSDEDHEEQTAINDWLDRFGGLLDGVRDPALVRGREKDRPRRRTGGGRHWCLQGRGLVESYSSVLVEKREREGWGERVAGREEGETRDVFARVVVNREEIVESKESRVDEGHDSESDDVLVGEEVKRPVLVLCLVSVGTAPLWGEGEGEWGQGETDRDWHQKACEVILAWTQSTVHKTWWQKQ
jgi:hypothetical protein